MGSPLQTAPRAYILDDEPGIRAFVCDVLSRSGYAAVPFSTMPALVEHLSAEPSDILILDLALGQSDAVEVMLHLERLGYGGKVLLISGRDGETLREIQHIGRSHGLSMLPPLGKPFRADDLRQRLLADVEVREIAPAPPANNVPVFIDLAEALDKNWLELWYQPKVDLKSLTICGAEALIRARHPGHGLVAPAGFLPPPNDPLYLPLSALVIQRAMAGWTRFAALGHPLKLAVNIPISVISAPGFVNLVREALPKDPAFPGLLIEVTENEVTQDSEMLREIANQLKLYNVWLSIDDFGSAYSTLSRMFDLPFAEVKLDRTFVSNASQDPLKGVVCQTVIDLAHRFGAVVCAEGVENIEDVRALCDRGCDIAQGYFFAKPMPADLLLTTILAPAKPFQEQVQSIRNWDRRWSRTTIGM